MTQGQLVVSGISIEPVLDGWGLTPAAAALAPPPNAAADWDTELFEPEGWRLPLGGFLIRTEDRVVLLDAGLGPVHVEGQVESGRLPDALRAAGVAPEEVTDVLLSHLHFDHVGWVSQGGVPTFPNAEHHWHQEDWEFACDAARNGGAFAYEGVADRLAVATDLWRPVTGSRTEVLPGIVLRQVPGHTPGNCLVEVGEGEDRVLLLGDTAHHHVELVEDGWDDLFDVDRDMARRARAELADELERTGMASVGAHFDDVRFGRIVRGADGRRRWVQLGEPGR